MEKLLLWPATLITKCWFTYNSEHTLMVEFGSEGYLDGQLSKPTGIAVTADNYILVSSRDKLQWFTIKGELVYAVGNSSRGECEFDHPGCITLGRDEKIYVLDKGNKRVHVLNGVGTYHSSFRFSADQYPEALSVNSEGKIFLSDTSNNSIEVFSPEGKYLSKFYIKDSPEPTQPTATTIDAKDDVYIGNASGVISVFDKDGYLTQAFRGSGSPGHYNVIQGLHVGKRGHIYVSDYSNNQVQVFAPAFSQSIDNITCSLSFPYIPAFMVGTLSSMPVKILENIRQPSGVATDKQGNIYIASHQESKVFVYDADGLEAQSQIKGLVALRHNHKSRDLSNHTAWLTPVMDIS